MCPGVVPGNTRVILGHPGFIMGKPGVTLVPSGKPFMFLFFSDFDEEYFDDYDENERRYYITLGNSLLQENFVCESYGV